MLYERVYYRLRGGGAYGEADALRAPQHSGVDAHNFALQVYERPAAVAVVYGGVRLYQAVKFAAIGGDGAPARAHDAQRNRGAAFERKRVAQRHNPIADFYGVGIAHLHGGKVGRLYLERRQVGYPVIANHGCVIGIAVG